MLVLVVEAKGVMPNAVVGEFFGESDEGEGTGRCPEGKGDILDKRGANNKRRRSKIRA